MKIDGSESLWDKICYIASFGASPSRRLREFLIFTTCRLERSMSIKIFHPKFSKDKKVCQSEKFTAPCQMCIHYQVHHETHRISQILFSDNYMLYLIVWPQNTKTSLWFKSEHKPPTEIGLKCKMDRTVDFT